jgi:hypothetical protein
MFTKMLKDLEDGNFFEKVGAVFQAVKIILTLKNTLKKAVDELIDLIISGLREQLWRVENF